MAYAKDLESAGDGPLHPRRDSLVHLQRGGGGRRRSALPGAAPAQQKQALLSPWARALLSVRWRLLALVLAAFLVRAPCGPRAAVRPGCILPPRALRALAAALGSAPAALPPPLGGCLTASRLV